MCIWHIAIIVEVTTSINKYTIAREKVSSVLELVVARIGSPLPTSLALAIITCQ